MEPRRRPTSQPPGRDRLPLRRRPGHGRVPGLRMQRPLLLEGEPGTGKTALAEALAEALGLPLVRLQCYEGIDATQALYDWDFPRQILHLRALEAAGGRATPRRPRRACTTSGSCSRGRCSRAAAGPTVLLVDEVDRADDEFEAFLLEVLSTYQVTIPELGTVAPPRRRSSCSPPTAPASCTTPSSGAASTTGSTTPASSARCRSCGRGRPRSARRWPGRSSAWCSSCAARRPAQATGRGRDPRLGARAAPPRDREIDLATAAAHAGRAGEVPRGRRPGEAGARPDARAMTPARRPDEILLGFARALRAAGVPVTQDRAHGFLAAVATLGLDDQRATYSAGRATLCAGPDDLSATTRSSRRTSTPATGCPGHDRRPGRDDPLRLPRRLRGRRGAGDEADEIGPRDGQRRPRCSGTETWPR